MVVEDVTDGKTGYKNSLDTGNEAVDLVMNALARRSDARG